MTEYIDQLTDKDGNVTHPKTLVRAIKDAEEKLLLNGGDQLNFRGIKNFVDGLQLNGKNVLTENFLTVDTCTDLHGVTKSGFYRYDEYTKNLPYMERHEFLDGYFFALFKDENDGIISFLGSCMYIEKYQGGWRSAFSPFPIKLWQGEAKVGDTLTFPDGIQNYSSLRFHICYGSGHYILEKAFDKNNNIFLTGTGINNTYNGASITEVQLQKVDVCTVKFLSQTTLDTVSGKVTPESDSRLLRIDGLRY